MFAIAAERDAGSRNCPPPRSRSHSSLTFHFQYTDPQRLRRQPTASATAVPMDQPRASSARAFAMHSCCHFSLFFFLLFTIPSLFLQRRAPLFPAQTPRRFTHYCCMLTLRLFTHRRKTASSADIGRKSAQARPGGFLVFLPVLLPVFPVVLLSRSIYQTSNGLISFSFSVFPAAAKAAAYSNFFQAMRALIHASFPVRGCLLDSRTFVNLILNSRTFVNRKSG